MDKLREQENSFKNRLSIIESELSNTPDPEHIKIVSKWTGKILMDASKDNPGIIFKKSFKWKRSLVENAFNGVNLQGQRLGV